VVLAIVDPGVGTNRRGIAVEVGEGASVLIGPDNGLLAPAVAIVGGATRAVELTNPDYQQPAPGPTFDGRDVFAPAAAHLCNGVPLSEFGPEIDPAGLRPGTLPITRIEGDALVAEVLWVDRFGNLQLNVDPDEVGEFGDRIALRFGGASRTGVRADTYARVAPGEVGLVVDSYGLLSIAIDRQSAAEELGLGTGDEVVLQPLEGQEVGSTSTPVTMKERPRR
jgi:S-adenosylmethionine hydrolase